MQSSPGPLHPSQTASPPSDLTIERGPSSTSRFPRWVPLACPIPCETPIAMHARQSAFLPAAPAAPCADLPLRPSDSTIHVFLSKTVPIQRSVSKRRTGCQEEKFL